MEIADSQVVQDFLVKQVIQGSQESWDSKARKVFLESREHQDLVAHQASQALGVCLVIQDRRGVMEFQAVLELQVHQERKVFQDHLVYMDSMVFQDPRDCLVFQV